MRFNWLVITTLCIVFGCSDQSASVGPVQTDGGVVELAAKLDKAAKRDKAERLDEAAKLDKAERLDKAAKLDKVERLDKVKLDKAEKQVRVARVHSGYGRQRRCWWTGRRRRRCRCWR